MTAHDPQDELHQVLTGSRPRRTAPWALYALPVIILVAGGVYWIRRELTRPAEPMAPVETSICEQLLTQASAAAPTKFFICASRAKTIYRLTAGQRVAMPLMANAVYDLPLDGRTRVEGLSSPDMRYGYRRGYCTALKPAFEDKTFLLAEPPVDLGSC
ncbi:MAG TPA: hypothetical protein VF459_14230 [Caulobacteraceae bacterium]